MDKNFDELWCEQLIATFIENGVDHFFIAPGSRSTCLVLALAENKKAHLHLGIDERSVAFMALGYGKKHQKPGVVITTSGTAVANLYPAVVEAYMSKTPMILLTADRPADERGCGANQVIFQAGMFSNHINQSYDFLPPTHPTHVEYVHAIKKSAFGPIHINQQFHEPLVEQASSTKLSHKTKSLMNENLHEFLSKKRGILVVGELLSGLAQKQILRISHGFGWPIFADIGSNMRFLDDENIIHHYDLGLLNKNFLNDLGVEAVVKFGGRLVSKRFWQWVKDHCSLSFLSFSSWSDLDPSGLFEHIDDEVLAKLVIDETKPLNLSMLKERALMIKRVVVHFLQEKNHNEAFFANRLIENLKEKTNLFISSSMPIRDLDQCSMPTDTNIEVFTNRGASGIDGIISSALGVAIADQAPTVLLLGDVAFLHDTNGLMFLANKKNVLIVVINNQGGGIFHLLPISKSQALSPWFDTPHDIDLSYLCKAHKVAHERVYDDSGFDQSIFKFFATGESKVLEVMIEKSKNVALHQELYKKIRDMKF
jgi:2-succinyl-5-enolpyruvyl-6-hydroxy-3-cyclohexene-1-carboxylate synthase